MVSREEVLAYVSDNYGTTPDYPWDSTPDAAVLRKPSKKWYALIMTVRKSIFYPEVQGCGDIINIKCSPIVREILIGEGKAFPAYHMNKRLWISIPLYGSISFEEICGAIDESYNLVR